MKIAYLTKIKDEERLIYYNLQYYYNLGIRAFFICLNNSGYETIALVNKFKDEHKEAEFFIYEDMSTAYDQVEMFNKMSDDAFNKGYAWQVPVDADEILHIKNGKSLQEILKEHDNHEYGFLNLRWIDYNPSEKDDLTDYNFFTQWKYREKTHRGPTKIIYKWSLGCKHGQGHHLLIAKRNFIKEVPITDMFLAHFANREKFQIAWKRIRIGEAFIEKYGEDKDKPQIKEYFLYKKQGLKYFDDIWEKIYKKRKDNFKNYVYDPINSSMFMP